MPTRHPTNIQSEHEDAHFYLMFVRHIWWLILFITAPDYAHIFPLIVKYGNKFRKILRLEIFDYRIIRFCLFPFMNMFWIIIWIMYYLLF